MEWTLKVYYGKSLYNLRAAIEYNSTQIMRIRVYGKTSSVLLENNYPLIYYRKSKAGVKWKIREGSLSAATSESSQLLMNIFSQLEEKMKNYLTQLDKEKLGF